MPDIYEGQPVVVEQSLANNARFDGSAPPAAPAADVNGVRIYPAIPNGTTAGGRFAWGEDFEDPGPPATKREFEFGNPIHYHVVERMLIQMNNLGANSYTVEIVNVAGGRTLWLTGGAGTLLISGTNTRLYLAPDEHLEIKTTGVSSGVCFVRVWARRMAVYGK